MTTSTQQSYRAAEIPSSGRWRTAWVIAFGAIACAALLYALYSLALVEMEPGLSKAYFAQLDTWVRSGSRLERVEAEVVEPCTHLVFVSAAPLERLRILPADRDRLAYHVQACADVTLSRGHAVRDRQARETRFAVCAGTSADGFVRKLCRRIGFTLERRASSSAAE